jgi:hypothetical protein
MLTTSCPKCSQCIKTPDEAVGRKVKCSRCGEVFVLSSSALTPAAMPIWAEAQPVPKTGSPLSPTALVLIIGAPVVAFVFLVGFLIWGRLTYGPRHGERRLEIEEHTVIELRPR